MRIGILTYFNVSNFGANLQALSTFLFLKKKGFSPLMINWLPRDLQLQNQSESEQYLAHKRFVERFFEISEECVTLEEVENALINNNITSVIIGSDAVLQHHPFLTRIVFPCRRIIGLNSATTDRMYPNPFWGCFKREILGDIKLFLMSASSQNSNYKLFSRKVKKKMKGDLLKFDYISVRDTWTSKMVCYLTDNCVSPSITPDPVFALNQNLENLIPTKEHILRKFNIPNDYVLLSFRTKGLVSENWIDTLAHFFSQSNISCIALTMPCGIKFEHHLEYEIKSPLDPLDWYALIKYSKGYIGENMHPIVVSLHNSVPFYCFDTYGVLKFANLFCNERSSKIYHILEASSLLNYRCTANTRFFSPDSPHIIYKKILEFDRKISTEFSERMFYEYNQMMMSIENLLT